MSDFVFNKGMDYEEVRKILRWVRHGDVIEYKTIHHRQCVIPENQIIYFRYEKLVKQYVGVILNYFIYGWIVDNNGEHRLPESNGAIRLTRTQGRNVEEYVKPKNGDLLVMMRIRTKRWGFLTYIEKESIYNDKIKLRRKTMKIQPKQMKKVNKIKVDSII